MQWIKMNNDDDRVELTDEAKLERAEWRVLKLAGLSANPEFAGTVISGYNGENQITIHLMSMQSGCSTAAIVNSQVDNPIQVVQLGMGRIRWHEMEAALNAALNDFMRDPMKEGDDVSGFGNHEAVRSLAEQHDEMIDAPHPPGGSKLAHDIISAKVNAACDAFDEEDKAKPIKLKGFGDHKPGVKGKPFKMSKAEREERAALKAEQHDEAGMDEPAKEYKKSKKTSDW